MPDWIQEIWIATNSLFLGNDAGLQSGLAFGLVSGTISGALVVADFVLFQVTGKAILRITHGWRTLPAILWRATGSAVCGTLAFWTGVFQPSFGAALFAAVSWPIILSIFASAPREDEQS